ncbi:ParB-like protein [Schumannella sp. 10F1B-5-1]|uniref:ParB-like protein n=1 Tax=Schumannella sp. 10F1B-5-1 TaxID=2590780 RepID=UPI0011324C7A|nr:ParB-like protein [Schumannella sp. 10F1B-5-1]TPW77033.1 chromosome partitioning protein ParB [Schumannella sp. 10F1B-5-1]
MLIRAGGAAAIATAVGGAALIAPAPARAAEPIVDDVPAASCAAGGVTDPYLCAPVGDLLEVRIGDVHPTQPSLGYDEVFYKLGRYEQGKVSQDEVGKGFGDWCEANGQTDVVSAQAGATILDPSTFECEVPVGDETADSIEPMKTVVIGPGGVPYLTDGHHTLTSFAETLGGGLDVHVRLRVLGNLSGLSEADFWQTMQTNKWVWLSDVNGDPIQPVDLPSSVGLANFDDDPYRSILYFGRDIGYVANGEIPFQEFYWGEWLRGRTDIDVKNWNQDDPAATLALVKKITQAQVALGDDQVVAGGFTAKQLGKLAAWNDGKKETGGEFGKLSKPYSDDKPGKVAHMANYRASARPLTVPATPATPTAAIGPEAASDVLVTWTAPATGRPVGYTVVLTPTASGALPRTVQVDGDATSQLFEGVAPGDYTATITASNKVGESEQSPASAPVTVAEETDPTDPTDPSDPENPATGDEKLVISGSLTAGGSIIVDGTGFRAGAVVTLELHSDPVVLGSAIADDQGALRLAASIPASTPGGAHTVVALIDGVQVAGQAVQIAAAPGAGAGAAASDPSLANTGVDTLPAAALAALTLAAGVVLLLLRQLRRGARRSAAADTADSEV